MNSVSTTASRWAVSTRTRGEVQTASVTAPSLELVLLGIPAEFPLAETEGWMRDLAGVAVETSRGDTRLRAIPALLHHALTGLLFSQAELWTRPGKHVPCSVAFVDSPEGAAFGWVGDARVSLLVDGGAYEPQWVIVRDADMREARAALLPADRDITLGLEFWPQGEDGSESPVAIEAEWVAGELASLPASATAVAPTPNLADPEPPAESAAAVPAALAGMAASPSFAALPQQQPGLAPAPPLAALPVSDDGADAVEPVDVFDAAAHDEIVVNLGESHDAPHDAPHDEPAPATERADALATPQDVAETPAPLESGTMLLDDAPAEDASASAPLAANVVEAAESLSAPRPMHPVGRWLGKLLGFGRRAPREPEPELAAPVSAYDSLLSASVPETPVEASEQTALELPPLAPPLLEEPDAPDFARESVTADAVAIEAAPQPVAEAPLAPEPIVAEPVLPEPVIHEPVAEAPLAPEPVVVPPVAVEPVAVAPVAELAPAEPLPLAPIAGEPPVAHVEASGAHAEVVRAMHDVDASALPVLPVEPVTTPAPETPLRIEREPVGAGEGFAIPRLPGRPAPPAGPPVLRVPVAPAAPAVPGAADEPSLAPRLGPVNPPVLRVHATADAPSAPPVLQVGGAREDDAPPVLRVTPASVPPPAIVPTPPVSPIAGEASAFVPSVGPAVAGSTSVLRPAWPVLEDTRPRRVPKQVWMWGGVVAAVFAAGWLLGVITNPTAKGGPGPVTRMLRAVGWVAPHYVASINSTPNGAWIAVDGKDAARRTPADLELPPGKHTLTLSLPELGSTQVQVDGQNGGRAAVNPSLNGGLEVYSSDPAVPISVSLDGREVGYAPVTLPSVAPGLHELQFTGPGMPAWAQTVQVGVKRTEQVVAHPMSAPANGVVQVQATLNDERGAAPLSGAQVFVDGQLRGTTPTTLDLPRGPHSLKLSWHGETAPVQVIDLPGGNQRFASFNFGLDSPSPQVALLGGVHPASAEDQAMVSATLTQLQLSDVREAWLHVSTPEGLWRRYAMTAMRGAHGPVVVCAFPPGALAGGSARWYVSASTVQGDEYFSEMQQATTSGGARAPAKKHTPKP